MKARRFLAIVLAAALLLLALGAAAWWVVLDRSPLRLQHSPLAVPAAARFVSRQAPLNLFLFTDGEQPLAYARAIAPPPQRHAATEALAQLRDGAFAAAGLDYSTEIRSWLGPEIGLTLVATGDGSRPDGWLLSLRSRDADGARRFLQRFWQTRSLAGTDLQITSYRGMGLISGRGALVGRDVVPIATALINDNLVLIASGRGVLEQALDVSQIDELNLAASDSFRAGIDSLAEGVALLTARPSAMADWLGIPPATVEAAGVGGLMAALRPDRAGLALEASFPLAAGVEPGDWTVAPQAASQAGSLLSGLRGEVDSLALLQNPAAMPPFLQPLLARALAPIASPLPALLLGGDAGPLLWAQDQQGWLLGTAGSAPAPAALEAALAVDGLIGAPLELADGEPVRVWAHLSAGAARRGRTEAGQLQAELAGARSSQGELAWWSQDLQRLEQQHAGRQGPRQQLAQLVALDRAEAGLQWAAGRPQAQALLRRWSSWRLLSGLAGEPLADRAAGLAVALTPDAAGYRLSARLDLA
ncbi:MAG: DUF3352 domain-containing protein [Cyanobacteriota bacterium]|nr:DUF3352 domain-containing protein [Cyanobacteriota bacterium]